MAKPPSKRRGISLDTRADTAFPLDEMSFETGEFPPAPVNPDSASDQRIEDPQLALQLQRMIAEFAQQWQRQEDQLQQQLQQLEQQGALIAAQTRELHALRQAGRAGRRLGGLLTLLVAVAIGASLYHAWPRIEAHTDNVASANDGLNRISPEIVALQGRVDALSRQLALMSESMTSVRSEITGVRSDLGNLHKAANKPERARDTEPEPVTATRQVAHHVSTVQNSRQDPYRRRYPMRPW